MREETELKWASNLVSRKELYNNLLEFSSATYPEFEKYANAGTNNNRFKNWFKKLIDLEIIEFTGYQKNGQGKDSETYSIDKKKLKTYIEKTNVLYQSIKRLTLV